MSTTQSEAASSPPASQKPAWGGAGVLPTNDTATDVSNSWGRISSTPIRPAATKSFKDLMSEDLAQDLQNKENKLYCDDLVSGVCDESKLLELKSSEDTNDDHMIAMMMQYELDKEYDEIIEREQNHVNGNSKVSLSFNKYKLCPNKYGPESDEEYDEVDDHQAIDSFEAREYDEPVIPSCGYAWHGDEIVTKHDPKIVGRKNAERIMNLPPGINTGDGGGFDMELSNNVYNKLQRSTMKDIRRSNRVHDKVEKATAEMALDPNTRLLIYKMVNNAVLETVNGIVSSGKEAVVFHAQGGILEDEPLPEECAVKVFKTSLTDFKTRKRYIEEDYRFKDRMTKNNTQKVIRLWAEKEYHNLRRLQRASIPSPTPILIKKHILLMSFIGKDHRSAPKLKEAALGMADLCIAYEQIVEAMIRMFRACRLVHADLSEYNVLWHEDQCWIIDVGQAVEPTHPKALCFLYRDCCNITKFFTRKGLRDLISPLKLFEKVSGINLPGPEEEAIRMIEEYETHQELWRESLNNISDQFEFLWNEIQTDELKAYQGQIQNDDEEDKNSQDYVKSFGKTRRQKERNSKLDKKRVKQSSMDVNEGEEDVASGGTEGEEDEDSVEDDYDLVQDKAMNKEVRVHFAKPSQSQVFVPDSPSSPPSSIKEGTFPTSIAGSSKPGSKSVSKSSNKGNKHGKKKNKKI
ncbi:unnamed protein product, partial [Meganyctiphanes norvegica]